MGITYSSAPISKAFFILVKLYIISPGRGASLYFKWRSLAWAHLILALSQSRRPFSVIFLLVISWLMRHTYRFAYLLSPPSTSILYLHRRFHLLLTLILLPCEVMFYRLAIMTRRTFGHVIAFIFTRRRPFSWRGHFDLPAIEYQRQSIVSHSHVFVILTFWAIFWLYTRDYAVDIVEAVS